MAGMWARIVGIDVQFIRFCRYRFTTGYVAELLLNGFKQPHGLLNAYVQHFTNFTVTDALRFVQNEGTEALPIMSQYRLDFSKLKRSESL